MRKLWNKFWNVAKFWIYWVIVVTLTIGLFFAFMDNIGFWGKDLEFYLAHKENLRHNFRLLAVISFILTYVLANSLINRLYKNKDTSFGKRLLWQTIIYFVILLVITAVFLLT